MWPADSFRLRIAQLRLDLEKFGGHSGQLCSGYNIERKKQGELL